MNLAPHRICLSSSPSERREVKLFVERKWWSLKFSISSWIEVWCQIQPYLKTEFSTHIPEYVFIFFSVLLSIKAPQIVGYLESYYCQSDIMHYKQDKPNVSNLIHFKRTLASHSGEGNGTPLKYSCLENPMDRGAWWAAVHGVAKSWTGLSDCTFTFHFHALEKEMATHSSVLAWRIPGMGSLLGCRLWGHAESDTTEAT